MAVGCLMQKIHKSAQGINEVKENEKKKQMYGRTPYTLVLRQSRDKVELISRIGPETFVAIKHAWLIT